MKQRQLGNGLSVSEIGLGCMGMDHAYGRPAPRDEMVRLLHHALELGCNCFDTAVVYGEANEELLGKAFSSVRDQVVPATKFGIVGQRIVDGKPINLLDSNPRPSANRWKAPFSDSKPITLISTISIAWTLR